MAMSLSELTKQLQGTPVYTPLTDEEMLKQAQSKYKSIYDQNRLSAQQTFDASDLALTQQRAGLETSYAKQADEQQKATAKSLSSADRYSIQRGMQRSSYNNATLANIGLEGNKALGAIQQALTTATGNIDQQRTLSQQQLAQQLAQYDTGYAADVQAYIDQLRQQEYERQTAANQYQNELAMKLYEYGQAAKGRSGGGGSSGSYSGGSGTQQAAGADFKTFGSAIAGAISAMQGAKQQAATINANKAVSKTRVTADPNTTVSRRISGTTK